MSENLTKSQKRAILKRAYLAILVDWYEGRISGEERARRKADLDAIREAEGL